jgi:hypothetical protein
MLPDDVDTGKHTVRKIVVEDLRKWKICSRFVLHSLTPQQKDRPAQSHNAKIVKQFLAQRKVTVFDHPSYSPDLVPADYFCSQK